MATLNCVAIFFEKNTNKINQKGYTVHMGLDMYAYEVSPLMVVDDFNFKEDRFTKSIELKYWRKHRYLHNWMEQLYREKGGMETDFNCIPLRLTLEDLNNLEKEIMSDNIITHGKSGFFFGNGEYDEDSKNNDLTFIYDAKRAIASGSAVYYNSWW